MKVAISKKTGKYYYIEKQGDFHSAEGILYENDLNSSSSYITSHIGREFIVLNATNHDISRKYKRGPQTILPKDLGYIISRTFIDKKSNIIEAGGGSGATTCFFASLTNSVLTYEIEEKNIPIINKNIQKHELENVTLTNKNLKDDIEDFKKKYDMLFLDLPNPIEILEKNIKCIKNGHYIVCYLPSIVQVVNLVNFARESKKYFIEEVSEINKREWKVHKEIARPHHRKDADHTAFLIFIRFVE